MKCLSQNFVCIAIFGLFVLSMHLDARESIRLDDGWRFMKYSDDQDVDSLIYDVRPSDVRNSWDLGPADAKPTEAVKVESDQFVLKPWILPCGNDFIADPNLRHQRPEGHPGSDFPFVQFDFDDASWEEVSLPHDWAIAGPFYTEENAPVGGGMGRLPSPGVAWYRNKLEIAEADAGKQIYLDIDGAMSYAIVWLNGNLVGGWPFGYSSFRLDLTPYVIPGGENQLAIRIDNPPNSSRWYPGGGLYRDVWITKTNKIHIAQWGTYVTTPEVSKEKASIEIEIAVENNSESTGEVELITKLFEFEQGSRALGQCVATFDPIEVCLQASAKTRVEQTHQLRNPRLWEPFTSGEPHLYIAVTELRMEGEVIDSYETRFGIRDLQYDPDNGLLVNNQQVRLQGVNQHHDLGALGAAFYRRAAERQLEILRDMGCNGIRMAHNPPDPKLLDLCDEMGFLVVNESFDVWERKKTGLGFHLIFRDWHEQDLRALMRRDRNHPSVIMWSIGNEVGEQYTDEAGAAIAQRLTDIVHQEDPDRPSTASMNWAKPDMPFAGAMDLLSLNYQGEGIRQDPIFEGTTRIQTPPMYPAFHEAFPEKIVLSSESACAFSSRGFYTFPITPDKSKPTRDGMGGDSTARQVSSYELYAVDFGSAADVVFEKQDQNPYVAGEFVWAGFDYLGEPTPYYRSRSSYCGIIDLAGFPKNRYYLYQSRWRPDFPMVHILPHWNWPERIGEVTPVHVFTSGDEAELFLNGKSLGKKKKAEFDYRLRWDDVVYEPGKLEVVAFKNGKEWAKNEIETTGDPHGVELSVDRTTIVADGRDLAFITAKIVDKNGRMVPTSNLDITFSVLGGEMVATDNGDATCMISFPSNTRPAFHGLCLAIVRPDKGSHGPIFVSASVEGLEGGSVEFESSN